MKKSQDAKKSQEPTKTPADALQEFLTENKYKLTVGPANVSKAENGIVIISPGKLLVEKI